MNSSQLLLVITDGRGLFLEGVDVVRRAVLRCVHDAHVFLVLIVLDGDSAPDASSAPAAESASAKSTADAPRNPVRLGQKPKSGRASILDIKVC